MKRNTRTFIMLTCAIFGLSTVANAVTTNADTTSATNWAGVYRYYANNAGVAPTVDPVQDITSDTTDIAVDMTAGAIEASASGIGSINCVISTDLVINGGGLDGKIATLSITTDGNNQPHYLIARQNDGAEDVYYILQQDTRQTSISYQILANGTAKVVNTDQVSNPTFESWEILKDSVTNAYYSGGNFGDTGAPNFAAGANPIYFGFGEWTASDAVTLLDPSVASFTVSAMALDVVPIAANDFSAVTHPITAASYNVTSNDVGFVAGTHYVYPISLPAEVTLDNTGVLTIADPALVTFPVSFSYEINDADAPSTLNSGTSTRISTATITITEGKLVNHWEFDGDATDTVAAKDGVVSGTAVYALGLVGTNCIQLDGTQSVDVTGYNTNFGDKLTVTMWAKGATDIGSNTCAITGYDTGTRNLNVHIPWSSDTVYFDAPQANRLSIDTGDASIFKDQWNHWAFTQDSETGDTKIYLNGALLASDTGSTATIPQFVDLHIGSNEGTTNYWKGELDDVRMYDYALTATEVTTLVDAVTQFYNSSTTTQTSTALTQSLAVTDELVIGIEVNMAGGGTPDSLDLIDLTVSGNAAGKITAMKVYSTGSSSTFATDTLVATVATPGTGLREVNITDTELSAGTNYFWVTYDIDNTIAYGDLFDAECNEITLVTAGAKTPTVTAPAGEVSVANTGVIAVAIASGDDDVEENTANGTVDLTSSDLELIQDNAKTQVVGLRFTGVEIPDGATITSAYVQFMVDTAGSDVTNLNVKGEFTANADAFSATAYDVTNRTTTTSSVAWVPDPWITAGDTGPAQQTPDLSAVLQEIVSLSDWTLGNAVVLTVSGTGKRHAESFNRAADRAPVLHVEYTLTGLDQVYGGTRVTQTSSVITGGVAVTDELIIGVEVNMAGELTPDSLGTIDLTVSGTGAASITAMNVYSTGTSSTFATTTQVGTVATPGVGLQSVDITDTELSAGTNYFWVTYDIDNSVADGDTFDAVCNSVGLVTGGAKTPAITDPDGNLTPVVGLEVIQTGEELSWIVTDESSVKEYQVVDISTGEVVEVVLADGSSTYSITLSEGVIAKLVVIDNSGFTQTFYPENGDQRTVGYNLVEGWNLITITSEDADLDAIKQLTTGEFWSWDGSAYELTSEPQPTQGVWIYSDSDAQVAVTGTKSEATIVLKTGWNLTGPVENSEVPEGAMIIYSWNDVYEAIATEEEVLVEGVGYWIFFL